MCLCGSNDHGGIALALACWSGAGPNYFIRQQTALPVLFWNSGIRELRVSIVFISIKWFCPEHQRECRQCGLFSVFRTLPNFFCCLPCHGLILEDCTPRSVVFICVSPLFYFFVAARPLFTLFTNSTFC